MIPLVIFIIACAILFFILFLIISRGRVIPRIFVFQIIYGILIAIPFFLINYYRMVEKNITNFFISLTIALILIIPSLVIYWFNILKKRYPITPVILLTTAIIIFIISSCLPGYYPIFFTALGFVFIIPYFIYIGKKPYLDASWLDSIAYETAGQIQKKGVYTSKPIIIKHKSERRLIVNSFGLSLFFKTDKVICWISRNLYKKINEPSLMEFFTALVKRIGEQTEKDGILRKQQEKNNL